MAAIRANSYGWERVPNGMAPTLPKPHKDRGMEGLVAKWYTSNTGQSMGEFAKLARRISDELAPGSVVLEVAPGPGYFCVELAKLGDAWTSATPLWISPEKRPATRPFW